MRRDTIMLLAALFIYACCLNVVTVKAQDRAAVAESRPVNLQPEPASQPARPQFMFVIHGGAGAIERSKMTPELEKEYRAKLTEALAAGYRILKNNGSGLDAVEAAIRIMEDSPLFNAGKGAVFTNAGTNELDASPMTWSFVGGADLLGASQYLETCMGLILGIGFPAFRGGILRWADTVGLPNVLERLKKYERLGPRFHPTEQMRQLAVEKKGFYPEA